MWRVLCLLLLTACSIAAVTVNDLVSVDIRFSVAGLKDFEDSTTARCRSLQHGNAEKLNQGSTPAAEAKIKAHSNDITQACIGKKHKGECILAIQGRLSVGVCLNNFVPNSPVLRCIIAEVIQGTEPCVDKNPFTPCNVSYTVTTPNGKRLDESHLGICGYDPSGRNLGCFTPRASRFLQSLEKDSVHPFAAELGQVTVGTQQWSNVLIRRHGGTSLCIALDAQCHKLPLQLDFGLSTMEIDGKTVRAPNTPFNMTRFFLSGNPFTDISLLRQYVGNMLARRAGVFAPESHFSRVSMNGVYLGLYTLVQDVTADDLTVMPELYHMTTTLSDHVLHTAVHAHNASSDEELTVAEGDYLFIINETVHEDGDVKFAQVIKGVDPEQLGWVDHANLHKVDCSSQAPTVFEPFNSLQFFQPNHFIPVEGPPVFPWFLHAASLHNALYRSTMRSENPRAWRLGLERVVNVRDGPMSLLSWLAINTALGNWATYGNLAGNYKMVAHACSGRLSFFTTEFSSVFSTDSKHVTAFRSEVDERWPLIRLVLDDDVYRAEYEQILQKMMSEVFTSSVGKEFEELFNFIRPHVHPESDTGESEDVTMTDYEEFDRSVTALQLIYKNHRQRILKGIKKAQKVKTEL